jgi:hypothetical protein
MAGWKYIVVEVANNGRTVYENGKYAKGHTKKNDLSALPKNMWNAKGKKMIEDAKGEILSDYGAAGWELVSVSFGDDTVENKYFFKKKA